jgi:hypothetical protein
MFTSGAFWGMYGLMIVLMLALQAVLGPFQVAFTTVMYVDQVRRIEIGPVPRPAPGQYGWQQQGPPPA